MRKYFAFWLVLLLLATSAAAQDHNQDSLVAVIDQKWERVRIAGEKFSNEGVPPVRAVIPENKQRQRAARENMPQGAVDPNEYTIDGRSAALEKNVRDARSVKTEDLNGFRYSAHVRNMSDRKIEIIFWEFQFKEIANSANFVRRQFLCSVKIKPGDKAEVFAYSTLGPSEVISTESLVDNTGKLFDEKVLINRIEYSDGAILQRRDWKMEEIRAEIKKATSTPWAREVCRPL
jgi:hypothetical protein